MIFDVGVAVAGAGPEGLLLASDLARAGVRCTVFERQPERSGLTRPFAVPARTLEQLDAHRGACGKTRVVPHNRWPGPRTCGNGGREVRVLLPAYRSRDFSPELMP